MLIKRGEVRLITPRHVTDAEYGEVWPEDGKQSF